MIINFVGTFNQPGYVGEISDETHLAREIENLGHYVRRIPRDAWREHILDPKGTYDVPEELKADINIIAKWHHFYDGRFIEALKERSGAPVFYWVWDFMRGEDWHLAAVKACDLYLGNDVRSPDYKDLTNCYYFPFDVCDATIHRSFKAKKKYNVIFTGSYLGQGDRVEWLKTINKITPVTIFSWNHEEWTKNGFTAHPAVYGEEYNQVIRESKVVLGFNVEPNCWGYWSNRVGKVIRAGGFLLQQYAPGMELLIGSKADYFSSPEEAIAKIQYYVKRDEARSRFVFKSQEDDEAFTSKRRVNQLMILVERYLKGDPTQWIL